MRAEKSQREIEQRFRSFINSANDSFILYDNKLNVIDVNEYTCERFGIKKSDFIGLNIVDISPSVKESGRYTKYMKVVRTGKPLKLEETIQHPQMGERLAQIKAFKVGENLGFIAYDLTERKVMEDALRESEEKYRTLFEDSRDAIFVSSLDGSSFDFNKSAVELLGYSKEELCSLSMEDLYAKR